MKLFIADAEPECIRQRFEAYPLDGVIVENSSSDALKKIRDCIKEVSELHVPINAKKADDIVGEAENVFYALGSNTYAVISVNDEGMKAMKILLETSEVPFTAIDVRTPMQALMAGKCGASYVMPFVNRLDSQNAVAIVKKMFDALNRNGLETELIAAHCKTIRQALELCEYGISVAVSPSMLSSLVSDE